MRVAGWPPTVELGHGNVREPGVRSDSGCQLTGREDHMGFGGDVVPGGDWPPDLNERVLCICSSEFLGAETGELALKIWGGEIGEGPVVLNREPRHRG